MSLLKNYFTSLFRNFAKDKFYSLLNLFGLGIGLASAVFIFLYIQNELSFDKYNENYERIYRLEGDFFINGKQDLTAITQFPLAPTLKDEYPEVEEMTRLFGRPGLYFEIGENVFQEDSLAFADSTVFKVFSFEFIHGDINTALIEPLTITLSESMALKYFGKTDIINESLKNLDGSEYRITGVFKDLPNNVHLRYNGLISAKTIEEQIGTERFNDRSVNSFWNVAAYSFVKLAENTTAQMVLDKFPEFYDTYMRELGDRLDATFDLRMTNIADVHYQKEELTWDNPKGNINYIYIMSVIAIFLVFIASVNYTNLTTARATKRAKEIGIRKVGGASKATLRSQFLGESMITSLMAGILAIALVVIFLPIFNGYSDKDFTIAAVFQPIVILFTAGLILLTGFFSGIYPASYLASFNPVAILKGASTGKSEKGFLRKSLVISQFVIAAFMIIGSIVVAKQINFIRNTPLGFDKEQIIVLTINDSTILNNMDAFREELKRNPDIEETGLSTSLPGRFVGKQVMTAENGQGEMQQLTIDNMFVDYDFIDVLGIKIKEGGRNFSREFGEDPQSAFLINEALCRELGIAEDAIGKKFRPGVDLDGQGPPEGQIIGVMEDFHYSSLHNPVKGMVFRVNDNEQQFMRTLSIRTNGMNTADIISYIEDTRESFSAIYPINYSFLEEDIDELYAQEKVIYTLFVAFTILVLFVSAIGLLGLSAFMTAKRTSETGVRRVMGASQGQILTLFLIEFSKWVIISNVIAWPIAWFVMKKWLENFEYRDNFPFWTFGVSLLASVVIAILTVSWQSIRASRMNPATSIRTE
jgi:putative ABC transport system permease protein